MTKRQEAATEGQAIAATLGDQYAPTGLEPWWTFVRQAAGKQQLRDVILASWQRSAAAGLTREGPVEFRRIGDSELAFTLAENQELLEVAKPHADWVSTFMNGVEHVVYLTDRNGIVLYSVGDLPHSEELRLSPGYDWSERTMGTNGAGTAIAADRPIAVIGPEHFATAFENCTCTAAPLRRDGKVIGAIDISTSVADASPDRIALVAHIAFVIEQELALRHEARQQEWYRRMAEALRAREQELLRANAQLEALLDNTTAIIYLVDVDARLLRINRRWETLFGMRNDETAGRSLYDFFPPEIADRFRANNRQVLEAGHAMEFEEEALVHGEQRSFLSVKVPIRDSSGAPYAICGISTDITERKAAEQRERDILRESSARKERFIAALAHELRSPLSAIMSAGRVVATSAGDAVNLESASGIILRQAEHVTRLVEQLLQASRAATKGLNLNRSRVDLVAVINQSIEAVRPTLDAAGQTLRVSWPSEPITVDGDATRLTQVFVNLLHNASQFSESGQEISIAASASGEKAVVSVLDQGCGIEPDALPKVFELMFQGGTKRSDGLGLGLSLVRGIVEAHGGSVTANSEGPGRGSEFVVRLECL